MFTGIIEEIGTIKQIEKAAQGGASIYVECKKILEDLSIGDSVAINGACQTAVKIDDKGFKIEASPETLNVTTFNYFKSGQYVNLERAMRVNSRFGGHIVTGHVDATGEFKKSTKQGISTLMFFKAPQEVLKYIIYKGSICIDGISLTVASLHDDLFSVAIIPKTIEDTILKHLKLGQAVNLESDIFAKYIESFVLKNNNKNEDRVTLDYLKTHGFM